MSLLAPVRQWLRREIADGGCAVAWSGGADSTALLLGMRDIGFRPQAWHVDHGWRADSAGQAQLLRSQAEARDIPFVCARIPGAKGSNREAVARQARYAVFDRWAVEQGVSVLCLGHHADDQAETVYLRLLQGAGAIGLRGMSRMRQAGNLKLLRPLLDVSRCEIEAELVRAGVGWLEDPSNTDQSLLRNRIRRRSFPAMRRAGVEPRELFNRLARQAARVADELEQAVNQVDVRHGAGGVSADWQDWSLLAAPVRALLLQRMMALLFGEGRVLGRRHLELAERWTGQGGRGGLDLSRCRLARQKGELRLSTSNGDRGNDAKRQQAGAPLPVR